MTKAALSRFRAEFRRWVKSHNEAHSYKSDAGLLLTTLESRIPASYLTQIGSAYLNGWLINETELGRGYFVREADRPGRWGGQFTLIHQGKSQVKPCWELYVQLADYAWLRTIAERYAQHVRLEDRLMDLTVHAGKRFVLYVEHKTTKATAKRLLKKMCDYGRLGVDLNEDDRGNDPLRKAKYLVRSAARPLYFGVSAIEYKQLFRVEYLENNRFELHSDERSFAAILAANAADETQAPAWSPVDDLAIEIQRHCPDCWVSVGSGKTAYNFYAPGEKEAIVVGLQDDGILWTDLKRLGKSRASRLSAALAELGIDLPLEKSWPYWKRAGRNLNVRELDPVAIATAIREAILS